MNFTMGACYVRPTWCALSNAISRVTIVPLLDLKLNNRVSIWFIEKFIALLPFKLARCLQKLSLHNIPESFSHCLLLETSNKLMVSSRWPRWFKPLKVIISHHYHYWLNWRQISLFQINIAEIHLTQKSAFVLPQQKGKKTFVIIIYHSPFLPSNWWRNMWALPVEVLSASIPGWGWVQRVRIQSWKPNIEQKISI